MIHKLFALLVVVVVLIVGVTVYLSPNDLARCDKPDMSEQCRAADAIVVISGGDTTARTSEAIRLYQHGWAPRIIVSGAAADKSSLSNAEVMRQQVFADADVVLGCLDNREARLWVHMAKAMIPERVCQIIDQAIQIHGATGISHWTPLAELYADVRHLRFADGPDEVHYMVVGRDELARH